MLGAFLSASHRECQEIAVHARLSDDRGDVDGEKDIRRRYKLLRCALNERTRRLFAAAEAKAAGYGAVWPASLTTWLTYRASAPFRDFAGARLARTIHDGLRA